jgi:parallel beta-helix repeat protein
MLGTPARAQNPAGARRPALVTAVAVTALLGLGSTPALAAIARPAAAATGSTYNVTRLADSGPGTLRWAIQQANASSRGTRSLIRFTVSGTVTLSSSLPALSRAATVTGQTAPRYRAGGPPVVEVNFNGHPGLRFVRGSGGSQLLGLSLGRASGNGVTLQASAVVVNRDYIGLSPSGGPLGNGGAGVFAGLGASRNTIGANPAHIVGAVGNVISGNRGNGITLASSSYNTVQDNRIGTNPAGSRAMPNGGSGILLTRRANNNKIGGRVFTNPSTGQSNNPTGTKGTTTPVFVVPQLGNLVSGNRKSGIQIQGRSRHNALYGNFVGTTASGNAALGNAGNGVWITGSGDNSLIGCKFVNNPFVYYNVISGNGANGVRITSSPDVTVQGNFLGSAANNAASVPNRGNGILVDGNSANTQVGGVIPLGNVSAGNARNGIEVAGTAHGFVTFNTFGGLHAFGGAAPNGRNGILITSTGGNNLVRTNVMSGNRGNGIELAGGARGVTVDPNIAGLTTNGMSVLANGGDGLRIGGHAHGNVIGGSLRSVIAQNTFSGNAGHGIHITGHAHANQVFSTFIGTAILGTKALGNQAGGVLVGGHAYRNWLGRHQGRRPVNLISGNHGTGVRLTSGTSRNRVLRNYIGLNRFGRPLPNSGRPVVNTGRRNVIRRNLG